MIIVAAEFRLVVDELKVHLGDVVDLDVIEFLGATEGVERHDNDVFEVVFLQGNPCLAIFAAVDCVDA